MVQSAEKLPLDREKMIESIWEYRWWILENRAACHMVILHEKQYKIPGGKHAKQNPNQLWRAREETDFIKWKKFRRGYKSILKFFVYDYEEYDFPERGSSDRKKYDYFHYSFSLQNDFNDYQMLLEFNYDELASIAFAMLTYLHRHNPLKREGDAATLMHRLILEDELQEEFLYPIKDVSMKEIKKKLKQWIKQEKLSEQDAYGIFSTIYLKREMEYIFHLENQEFHIANQTGDWSLREKFHNLYNSQKEQLKQNIEAKEIWTRMGDINTIIATYRNGRLGEAFLLKGKRIQDKWGLVSDLDLEIDEIRHSFYKKPKKIF